MPSASTLTAAGVQEMPKPVPPGATAERDGLLQPPSAQSSTHAARARVLPAVLLALGLGLDTAWGGFLSPRGEPLPFVTLVAVVLSVAMSVSAYYGGARLVMASLCAQPLQVENPEHRQLFNIVTEMALACGLPQPQLYVIPDPAPNALSAGRDPRTPFWRSRKGC